MSNKYEIVKLGDLGTIVGGATPSTKNPENWDGDIPWLSPKDLTDYNDRYISRGERNITQKGYDSCSTKMLPKNSILFSSRAPIGYIAIADSDLCTNQGFKSIIPNENTDPLYLYYLLKYNKDNIANKGSGTTFSEVSGKVMWECEVNVILDLGTQKRIGKILDSFDKKIELNTRIISHLEILFDTYSKQFLQEIIKSNYATGSLLDIAKYTNGFAMQKYRPNNVLNSLPVLKIKELRQGFCNKDSERCTQDIDESVCIHDGDLIFSWSGTLMLRFWTGGNAGLNQHLFKVTSEDHQSWFYYLWTKYHMKKFVSMAKDRATTMGHIKRSALADSEVIIPDTQFYEKYTKIMQPIINQMIILGVENRKLAELRDTLLPKLMSGEIEV